MNIITEATYDNDTSVLPKDLHNLCLSFGIDEQYIIKDINEKRISECDTCKKEASNRVKLFAFQDADNIEEVNIRCLKCAKDFIYNVCCGYKGYKKDKKDGMTALKKVGYMKRMLFKYYLIVKIKDLATLQIALTDFEAWER